MQKKEMVNKEKPILFSAEMVQAILAGNKTQTRRVVKPQPNVIEAIYDGTSDLSSNEIHHFLEHTNGGKPIEKYYNVGKCPYGKVGDRLWVRETYCLGVKDNGEDVTIYKASVDDKFNEFRGLWRPSIFMPRKYSRILLEITGVRVERLHDISKQDAIAEGIVPIRWRDGSIQYLSYTTKTPTGKRIESLSAKQSYFSLWEKINGRKSLESNPWVWVIEFKRVEARHD